MIKVTFEKENNSNIVTYLYWAFTMAQALPDCFILGSSINLPSKLINVHCRYFIDEETDMERGPVNSDTNKGHGALPYQPLDPGGHINLPSWDG